MLSEMTHHLIAYHNPRKLSYVELCTPEKDCHGRNGPTGRGRQSQCDDDVIIHVLVNINRNFVSLYELEVAETYIDHYSLFSKFPKGKILFVTRPEVHFDYPYVTWNVNGITKDAILLSKSLYQTLVTYKDPVVNYLTEKAKNKFGVDVVDVTLMPKNSLLIRDEIRVWKQLIDHCRDDLELQHLHNLIKELEGMLDTSSVVTSTANTDNSSGLFPKIWRDILTRVLPVATGTHGVTTCPT